MTYKSSKLVINNVVQEPFYNQFRLIIDSFE